MSPDLLEFAIAQYADGTLSAGEAAALEAELATDARARAMLAEYRGLNASIAVAKGMSRADVQWDLLAARISDAVAGLEAPAVRADVSEESELAVAQYADGTMPAEQRAEFEAKLANDPALADLLINYQRVDELLRADALPTLHWDRLAKSISGAVAQAADGEDAISEEGEFAIARYADGSLPLDEVEAVELELADHAAARLMFAHYRSLDRAIAQVKAVPVPAVQWDRLAAHLSRTIADEESPSLAPAAPAAPASYRIFAMFRSPMRLAVAASVLLAAGLGIYLSRPDRPPIVVVRQQPTATVVVVGPTSGAPAGDATIEVTIGPPAALAQNPGEASGFADDIASRPSRTIIAGGLAPVDEGDVGAHPFQ